MPPAADTTVAQRAARVLRRLSRIWSAPTLTRVPITACPRLTQTLGRVVLRPLAIQLSPTALVSSRRIEILTHEAAHAVLALNGKARTTRPHGPEWRRLMALAGFPNARATRTGPCIRKPPRHRSQRYEHRCPVCQTTRSAKRPVPQWRCAACVEAGLEGRLVVLRAPGAWGPRARPLTENEPPR